MAMGKNKAKLITWCVIITAVAIIYVIFNARSNDNTAAVSDTDTAHSHSETAEHTTTTTTHHHGADTVYTDGTYRATSRYSTPGGSESIEVTISLKDNVVTTSSVQQTPNDREAAEYQAEFKQNYKPLVEGKKISDINLSRVSGSSLTSRGFNDAVENIKSQAHHHDS
ncbi:MAG: hypothetical protein JWP13_688 [Candidatus Saccharibacteria bacterium]|nr:hypothetical protein [Candidatus Saccharibacteria bacterium]